MLAHRLPLPQMCSFDLNAAFGLVSHSPPLVQGQRTLWPFFRPEFPNESGPLPSCAKSGPYQGGRHSGLFALYPFSVLRFCEERSSHHSMQSQGVSGLDLSQNLVGANTDSVNLQRILGARTRFAQVIEQEGGCR